jgi:hypothetical protein
MYELRGRRAMNRWLGGKPGRSRLGMRLAANLDDLTRLPNAATMNQLRGALDVDSESARGRWYCSAT